MRVELDFLLRELTRLSDEVRAVRHSLLEEVKTVRSSLEEHVKAEAPWQVETSKTIAVLVERMDRVITAVDRLIISNSKSLEAQEPKQDRAKVAILWAFLLATGAGVVALVTDVIKTIVHNMMNGGR